MSSSDYDDIPDETGES